MEALKPVGPGASARKYDILSAMMAYALREDKSTQRLVMRLMALITTRYNWQRDELCTGQREIARLWSVDQRTVKREMAKLRARGWLVQKRQGARGRVSVYGLGRAQITEDTREAWPLIGEDFVMRFDPDAHQGTESKVVPLRPVEPPRPDGTVWATALMRLHAANASSYANWFSALVQDRLEDGCLVLVAPNRFHARYVAANHRERLLATCRAEDPSISDLRIVAE